MPKSRRCNPFRCTILLFPERDSSRTHAFCAQLAKLGKQLSWSRKIHEHAAEHSHVTTMVAGGHYRCMSPAELWLEHGRQTDNGEDWAIETATELSCSSASPDIAVASISLLLHFGASVGLAMEDARLRSVARLLVQRYSDPRKALDDCGEPAGLTVALCHIRRTMPRHEFEALLKTKLAADRNHLLEMTSRHDPGNTLGRFETMLQLTRPSACLARAGRDPTLPPEVRARARQLRAQASAAWRECSEFLGSL